MQALSVDAHRALGCEVFSRLDWMVDGQTLEPYILEVNTIPGMTETSLLPKIAAHAGLDFGTLLEEILGAATLHAPGRAGRERRIAQVPFNGPERRAADGTVEHH